ncbi:MAG: DUF4080 domain-containing protein [Bacillota bacterium]|jgi:radical SAM superfamily enzyme YgiQ (UPF0313 family)
MLYEKPLLVAVNSRYTHSNPAVYCLKSYVRQKGFQLDFAEFNINGQPLDILAEIVKREPDLVGFSCYIWNIRIVTVISKMLKKVLPQCKILWGGPQMNGLAEKWLEKYEEIDYIIEGEGEKAWVALLQAENTADLRRIPNFRYRQIDPLTGEQKIVFVDKVDFVNLSELPFYYSDDDLKSLRNRIIYYESSRGCPFGCKFCLSAREPVRYRDLEKVKADLEELSQSGCKKIKFVDRTFNSNQKRAVEILKYLLSIYHKDICFHLELEPLCLSEDLVDILLSAPAGYFQAEIGVQSLYEPALDGIGRRKLADNAVDLIRRLIEAENIHIHLDLIAGLPYETLAEFKNSFDGLYDIEPHYLQLGFLKILPGTPLAEQAADYGLVFVDEPPYQVLRTPWLSYADMQELSAVEYAVDNYYNEAFFEKTLKLGMKKWCNEGGRPFDFFCLLGKTDKHIDGGKSQTQKGKILFDFLSDYFPEQILLWQNVLRLDFICSNLNPPEFLGVFDEMTAIKADEALFMENLPPLSELPRRRWLKRFRVFQLVVDVDNMSAGLYVADGGVKQGIWQRPQIIKIK